MMMMIGESVQNYQAISVAGGGDFSMFGADYDAIFGVFEGESGLTMSYLMSLNMFSTASVIVLILLTGTAGGEQKKRSIIIPQTAGLKPSGYVLPKFIMYPPMVFVMTVLSALLANGACHLIFKMSYSFEAAVLTGSLYGMQGMFTVCLYMFLGISLAQPALSVIYVLVADTVFSIMIVGALQIDKYTPWNLTDLANSIVMNMGTEYNMTAIVPTIMITLAVCVGLMLLTLFANVAKRMDNTADEVY
jgi:ABC-2 type transport system permease protein